MARYPAFAMPASAATANDAIARVARTARIIERPATMFAMVVIVLAFVFPDFFSALYSAPIAGAETLADFINAAIGWFVGIFKPLLRTVARGIDAWVRALQWLLHATPWTLMVLAVVYLGWRYRGPWLGIMCGLAVLYMALSGYWIKSMNTLSMVGVSVPLALATGFALGVFAAKSERARMVIEPVLDLMQTIPTFAYLVPLVVLFGFGPVPGVLASTIYAAPPLCRNVLLGLRAVPSELHEVASMSGTSAWQRFISIELPNARNQILVGINQLVLASLSMVIIAAVIGGFDDIGREVLISTNKGSARFGQALGAGIVIVILAVVIDRLTRAIATYAATNGARAGGGSGGHSRVSKGSATMRFFCAFAGRFPSLANAVGQVTGTLSRAGVPAAVLRAAPGIAFAVIVVGLCLVLSDAANQLAEATQQFFRDREVAVNMWLTEFITRHGATLDLIKNKSLVYLLLPLRIGLTKAVLPFTWGVSFPQSMQYLYLFVVIGGGALLFYRGKSVLAGFAVGGGLVAFTGFTYLPWWAVVATVCWLCARLVDLRFALVALGMMLLITYTGHWEGAMYSVYLCSAAVLICIVIGCPLGILAAKSEVVSRIIAPINDTLQSIPLYIFLIPAVALFQVNEFSALVAIVLYAIVPITRYTEHGLRHVPTTLIEAATANGCSPWQRLVLVELPVARASILLGLNQTVLFSLAMLIIAVLVGARGLAEQVNIGLRDANTGLGMTAGLSMAFIAIIADRVLRGWAARLGRDESAAAL